MYLFLSDLHLGRGFEPDARLAEQDAIELLQFHESELLETNGALFLVGDVFDQYMEYKHLVPKGFVRFFGLLAEWTDKGIPITYVVGNRDPWHLTYFEDELAVRVIFDSLVEDLGGKLTYISHGDGYVADEWFYNRIRAFMRHPFIARLYRMCLPGDAGFSLARWFAHTFSSDGASNDTTVNALKTHAADVLRTTEANLVVMGHCHRAECIRLAGGAYINPGYWFADRTFAVLDEDGPRIETWNEEYAHTSRAPATETVT